MQNRVWFIGRGTQLRLFYFSLSEYPPVCRRDEWEVKNILSERSESKDLRSIPHFLLAVSAVELLRGVSFFKGLVVKLRR